MENNKEHNQIDLMLEEDLNSLKNQQYLFSKDITHAVMQKVGVGVSKQNHKNIRRIIISTLSAACVCGMVFFTYLHKVEQENELIAEMLTEVYAQDEPSNTSFEEFVLLENFE